MSRQRQTLWWASGVALAGVLGWVGWRRWHAEPASPGYQVLGVKDGLEVRQYRPLLVAATELTGPFTQCLEEGFHRLAGYIFGGNTRKESIAMTAPVGLQRRGEAWRVTFVMPPHFTLESLPTPRDERVRLEPVPARRVAVRRFSGAATEAVAKAEREWLLAALRRQGLQPVGEPVLAQYNSPFVPPFLRRNEILVDVRPLEWVH